MKYLKVLVQPIKIKGSEDDIETLQADLFERLTALIESETLTFEIIDEDEDSDED
jgi:hypothetical protein